MPQKTSRISRIHRKVLDAGREATGGSILDVIEAVALAQKELDAEIAERFFGPGLPKEFSAAQEIAASIRRGRQEGD